MFCGHCGKLIPEENAAFCPHCGTAVLRPQRPESPTPQQGESPAPKDADSPQQKESSDQKKRPESLESRIFRTLVGIAVILFCLLGFVLYILECLAAGSLVPSASDLFFLLQVVFGLFFGIIWVKP